MASRTKCKPPIELGRLLAAQHLSVWHLSLLALSLSRFLHMLSETVARRLCLLRTPSSGLRAVGRPALPRIARPIVSFPHRSGTNMSSTAGGPAAAAHPAVPEASSGVGAGGHGEDIREKKKALRKRIKSELKQMSDEAVGAASAAVAEKLLAFPQLQQLEGGDGGGGAVSVYLSMPKEISTSAIVSGLFKRGKKVYIPKVGKNIDCFGLCTNPQRSCDRTSRNGDRG